MANTSVIARIISRATRPTLSSLAKRRPKSTSFGSPTLGAALQSYTRVPRPSTYRKLPTELVWLIFAFTAASGKVAALHVSLVCREARRIALPYALSVFSRWSASYSHQIDSNVELRTFRLPLIRHLSLDKIWLEHAAYHHIVTNCHRLSDLCLNDYHLSLLSFEIHHKAVNGMAFNNLSLTLRRFPGGLQGHVAPLSSLYSAVTRLIFPGICDNDYDNLQLLVGLFPNLTHLALPVTSDRSSYYHSVLPIAIVEAHINMVARLVKTLSLQIVVTTLYSARWTMVKGGIVHYSLRAYERLHKLAASKDERIHFVIVDYNTMDEEAIHERWEAEAWGSETIWEKAARVRRRIRQKYASSVKLSGC